LLFNSRNQGKRKRKIPKGEKKGKKGGQSTSIKGKKNGATATKRKKKGFR